MTEVLSQEYAQALQLLKEARQIVALSGAGISTEAGIPDFRSQGGIWQNSRLVEQLSVECFQRDPAGFYQACLELLPNINRAQPTLAHRLLAQLEQAGKLIGVVTQNIDGLHQAAGSTRVYEIHGNFRTGHCVRCRRACQMSAYFTQLEQKLIAYPQCEECGGPIKPDVILFGDILPMDVWEAAVEAVEESDLLLVLGSSLVVYPAAGLPQIALSTGSRLLIVNREPTRYDWRAEVVVHGMLGDFARAILDRWHPAGPGTAGILPA